MEKDKEVRQIRGQYLLVPVVLAAVVLFLYRCPILWLTGVPCPGCGMTRAFGALLRLDLPGAFYYHPLFWLVPLIVLYLICPLGSSRTRRFILLGCGVCFFAVYICRMLWMPESLIALH